jgi:site-specific DNA-cytosine methylase
MLRGLDLFSGIGGLSIALSDWVRPVAYCESDRYPVAVLLSRMAAGSLPSAPIWDDVRTLGTDCLSANVDIIYGGFPCQDISVAGDGVGLEGGAAGRLGMARPSLETMARKNLWPTPCARDSRDCGAPAEASRNTPSLAHQPGGQLNPTWVEWLMGYPLGWTELEDWAMQWFRSKRKSRSKG